MRANNRRPLLLVLLATSLSACAQSAGFLGAHKVDMVPDAGGAGLAPTAPIKHIVIVVQENRSFENIFAGYPGASAPTYGKMSNGSTVPLRPTNFLSSSLDLGHTLMIGMQDWDNGKMDKFDLPWLSNSHPAGKYAYSYLERAQVAPYWSMAQQYVLADHMFPSEWGASFTAHLDLIAGTTLIKPGVVEADNPSSVPWGCNAVSGTLTNTWSSSEVYTTGGGPFPCFTQFETMANTLDAAGVSWRYYAPKVSDQGGQLWSAFSAISAVYYGADWQNVVTPQTNILTDAASASLPAVSWVVPDYQDSDHPGNQSDTGPSWVSAIVNAVGQGPNWNSTAIIVLWDDWGGWYDNMPPPQLDFAGLGIRVPCLIISPYAKQHYVSHTRYEFGSILKFVEQTFNAQSLGATDVRANSLLDSFNFMQPARRFSPIAAKYSSPRFMREKASRKPPDDD